ncbi:Abi family protein [Macrococcoides caseolyticum]|uniref:Abi family protein n=1 Tax=Macrococcoides caseolyticum TaxID=69966 RepID=UPI000C346D64|nr:Abi family protein [Macrococcus caseolyticus]PKE47677.1 hypothetical protein CW677_06660 [Macrococcus caseolyticus]PKF14637.1 hypothetical protein CW690_06660 [Macrococcus caseolyticus]
MPKYLNSEEIKQLLKKENIDTNGIFDSDYLLNIYGYYNIINAYRNLIIDDTKKFDYYYALFKFDNDLKSIVLKYILLIEMHYKYVLSDVLSSELGPSIRDYLNPNNYKSSAKSNLSKAVNQIKFNEKPMYSYFNEEEGIDFPPWIFLKAIPFGNAIKIYSISKGNIKDRVANEMITNTKKLKIEDKKRIFADSIEILRLFRNSMAHGNRLLNHKIKKDVNFQDYNKLSKDKYISLEQYNLGIGKSDLLALLYTILILLKHEEARNDFISEINTLFNSYEIFDEQNFIDLILSVSNLPNNFLDILSDGQYIWY